MAFTLDYDQWIHLDAEDLAETGIAEAYERLLPELRKYVPQPARVEEVIDNDTPVYSVRCGGKDYAIYGPDLDEEGGGSWGRATVAFFALVNDQLAGTAYRFYAINGGNDLGGMFLTPAQAQESRASLPRPQDWPYLPTDKPPWYGQHHRAGQRRRRTRRCSRPGPHVAILGLIAPRAAPAAELCRSAAEADVPRRPIL